MPGLGRGERDKMQYAFAILIWLSLLSNEAVSGQITQFPGLTREALKLEIRSSDGTKRTLEAMVIRPKGTGSYPLALISHGTNRDKTTLALERPQTYTSPALAFAQHGYAAVVVMRSGFGASTGLYAEARGPCGDSDYLGSSRAAAGDVMGALSALKKEHWVDPMNIVLVGHSTGGLADIAVAASNPPGVRAVVSFGGGNGSIYDNVICRPDQLIEANRIFGETAKVPSLWIYAHNDHFFPPHVARQMFAAYTSSGAKAWLFEAPSSDYEGHYLIWAPEALWWDKVASFLASLNLPIAECVPTSVSIPNNVVPPSSLDDSGRIAFASYLRSRSFEKAFAIATETHSRWVHWNWVSARRTKTDASKAALEGCQRLAISCKVYAVGNKVLP